MPDQAALAYFWAALVSLVLALYVTLDGFDLGIGLLSLFTPNEKYRAEMMSIIGAFWDANETWLVIAGGVLFGAFPVAYAVLLNGLYVPIMIMLFGLIFRAVSFEFKLHSKHRAMWEYAFGAGSLVAVLGQGFALGGFLTGLKVSGFEYVGGPWDWLSPLTAVVTVAVGMGYAIIGASYLLAKTTGRLHTRMHRVMIACSILLFCAVAAVTVAAALILETVSKKWFAAGWKFLLYAVCTGAVFAFAILLLTTKYRRHSWWPFLASLAFFLIAFGGLLVAIFPYIVPASITLVEAAASAETLVFMLFGIALLIPVMLAYNIYMYRVFHGGQEELYESE